MQSVDSFVDIISEDGHIDAALPSTSDTSLGEAGPSSKVLATSTGEETSALPMLSEDVTLNGSPPVQNEQSLQNNFGGSANLNDSDMDMEDDGDFSEPDIEPKHGELDNRFQESRAFNSKLVDENGKLSASNRDMSYHQINHLLPTTEANELEIESIELKAAESENRAEATMVINPTGIQSAEQENKNTFVHRMQFKNGSPLRHIQDYASDENTDDENSISDVTPTRTAVETEAFTPVLKDDSSQMHLPNDQVNIDTETGSQATNVLISTNLPLVSAETLPSDANSLEPVDVKCHSEVGNSNLREVGETSAFINHEQVVNASDTETKVVDATDTSPKHDNLENAVDTLSFLEDKKPDPVVQKVDEFGRMIREGVSESDSELEDMRYSERYAKRGSSRSSEVRWRRSRSPRHRTDKKRSPSWSPRRERSRSPASSRRVGESAWHGRSQLPQCFNFLRGKCRHGSSCRYLHSDFIQDRVKPVHHRGFSNNFVKYETHKGMENVSQETVSGQEYYASPDMHEHDRHVCIEDNFDQKQSVHTAYGDDKGVMSCPVAPSPGHVEVDDHTFHEIAAVEPKEEQDKHHSLEESDQKSVEQQPSPPHDSMDKETPSLGEVSGNQLGDHIILQHSQGTSVLESLPLPDEKTDTAMCLPLGPIFSKFPETTVSQPSIPSDAISSYQPKPSGFLGQQLQPSQVQISPPVGAPPAPIFTSSVSSNFFPPPQNPSLANQFHSADAFARTSWTEVQPTIPVTGNYPFQFSPMPPRNEILVQSNVRPVPSFLDGVPSMGNYEFNQSSHPSVAAHQFLHRPAGTYQVGPVDGVHRESHTSFLQNAPSLPMLSHVNMVQGQYRVPPVDNFQKNSLIFPNESGTSRPRGDFHPLSNSTSQPQRLMHGFQSTISNTPSIHGMPSTLEPPFSNQSAGFQEYKQELLPSGVGVPKVASTAYYNPFASTFEQTHREPRYSTSFVTNRDSFNEHGQWAASSSASRSGAFFASLPGTTVSTSYEGISYQGQTAAPTSGALKHVSDVTTGKPYDPLSDSFDSLGAVLRKIDHSQEKSVAAGTSMGLENDILENTGKLLENNQPKVSKRSVNNFDDEVGETATDTEAGAVENGSPLLDDGKDWNPEVPAGNTGPGAAEIEQQPSPGKSKKGKDSRSMKLFKIAIANFVKEILKPSWRQGNMSKEAFKTIVKKTVDKVAGAMPNHQVPKSQAKIDQYVESSQRKLTKLVMGYVEKYVKT